MKREIIITKDGSSTIYLPEINEQYHSKNGSIEEAYHVYIKYGLDKFKTAEKVTIMEAGFGTGLNAFITFLEHINSSQIIDYVGVEAYPVSKEEMEQLNYVPVLKAEKYAAIFKEMHTCNWEEKTPFSSRFSLTKQKLKFQNITEKNKYNLIYFDAFGARVQPELWTEEIFKIMYAALKVNGVLVTYSAKGSVRRAMQSVGFSVERLPGAAGKREMLRAIKSK
ncbi:MAG TPA: SAM-dependent methyltransferase [Flavobacteriaceae bacterium]|nr:SAM-dependent methyltransferase [Flavobacteriaceae bacterium]HIP26996.1 SAM-dependent methyltransferase [Flavobacteriaceae bacterium]